MKKPIIFLIVLLMLLSGVILNAQNSSLLPAPQNVTWGKDKFQIAADTALGSFAESQDRPSGQKGTRLLLVKGRQPQVAIFKGQGDDLSVEKIVSALGLEASQIRVVDVSKHEGTLPSGGAIIVGSLQSNPLVKELLQKIGLDGQYACLTEDGYLLKTSGNKLLVIGKGELGTLYAACELKNLHFCYGDDEISVAGLNVIENPTLKYRWFWNWDSRTHWVHAPNRELLKGHGNGWYPHVYGNGKDVFLRDFKTMIDFAAEHRINGIIVWGFLRDEHGGVEAAKEICEFASKRGVRIMPGVGPNQYNGFYYQGDHQFNSVTWAKDRPYLRALGPVEGFNKPEPIPTTLCLLKKENQQWLRDGVNWMYDNFAIGGLDVETSESWTCQCEDHKRLQGGPHRFGDVELAQRIIMEEVRKRDPKAWIILNPYDHQGGYSKEQLEKLLDVMPESIVLWYEKSPGAYEGKFPGKKNVQHLGWSPRGYQSPNPSFDAYKASIENAWRNEVDGVMVHGEGGAYLPNFETVYLTFSALAWNPKMGLNTLEDRISRFRSVKKAAIKYKEDSSSPIIKQ